MKFLVLGTMVPPEYEVKIPNLSNASNRFLMNLLGSAGDNGQEIKSISYIGIPVSEDIHKALISEQRKRQVSYVFKTKNIITGVFQCHKLIKSSLKDCDLLLAYNVVYAWLLAPVIAHYKRKKAVLILADFSDIDAYHNIGYRLYAKLQKRMIRKFDVVVGLSENIKSILKKRQRFVCIEGGINKRVYDFFEKPKTCAGENVILMYAGILEKVTGIDLLLKAFQHIENRNLKLYISGKGSMEQLVKQAAKQDERIRYLGCPEYDEYLSNLKKADILINPRNMNLPENRNNFPSKVMEYLATGKPIISTRFAGWKRFEENIYFCDTDIEAVQKRIAEVSLISEVERVNIYKENRIKAQEYLWDKQVKKILQMI